MCEKPQFLSSIYCVKKKHTSPYLKVKSFTTISIIVGLYPYTRILFHFEQILMKLYIGYKDYAIIMKFPKLNSILKKIHLKNEKKVSFYFSIPFLYFFFL